MTHPAALDKAQLLADCRSHTTRRSGPGGQHRNKVETAVVYTHMPSGISAEANEERSQEANRQVALHRLRLRLAVELRGTEVGEPSELWRSRTRGGKLKVNPAHVDYPALIAEALDFLAASDFSTSQAADTLGVSATQLVGLLRDSNQAFALLNRERESRGLRRLK